MVDMADSCRAPIFPEYQSPTDWPAPLHVVVGEARRIISYYKELPEKDRPPKSLWHSPAKCKEWIDRKFATDIRQPSGGMLEFSDNEQE